VSLPDPRRPGGSLCPCEAEDCAIERAKARGSYRPVVRISVDPRQIANGHFDAAELGAAIGMATHRTVSNGRTRFKEPERLPEMVGIQIPGRNGLTYLWTKGMRDRQEIATRFGEAVAHQMSSQKVAERTAQAQASAEEDTRLSKNLREFNEMLLVLRRRNLRTIPERYTRQRMRQVT
jgi:hypothetical protein